MAKPQDTRSPAKQSQDTQADPWDEFYDDLIQYAWQPALRFTLDGDHAAERCQRRACRVAGRCCITPKEGEPLNCGGGRPSDEVMLQVCRSLLFSCIVARRLFEDLGFKLPPPIGINLLGDASPVAQPASRRRKAKQVPAQ
jgi:hypothetical protein